MLKSLAFPIPRISRSSNFLRETNLGDDRRKCISSHKTYCVQWLKKRLLRGVFGLVWVWCQLQSAVLRIWGVRPATHCCSQSANHSAMTNPSKRMSTNCMASRIGHSSEGILSRNKPRLGCLHLALVWLHLALAYRYYLCIDYTWEQVSMHWQQSA